MKIIIFGASGTVGVELVKQALAKGYHVTAFVRNTEKLKNLTHVNLKIDRGDLLNFDEVASSINGKDAVFCAIGDGNVGKIRADGTKNIIAAMHKTNTSRLICQTTLGMGESYENLNFIWKHIMFGIILKKAFKDHQMQEKFIFDSDLNYTVVRPSALTDEKSTNGYQAGFNGKLKNLKLKIARIEVAEFMISQLDTNEYSRKAVSLSS